MRAEPLCVLVLEEPAEPSCLDRVHDLVAQMWARVPEVDVRDRERFEIAVIEVAGNIVEHGGRGVRLRLRVSAYADQVEARFWDSGCPAILAEPRVGMPGEDAEDGRGLALAAASVDEVRYERIGATNRWRVLQRRAR